MIVLCVANQHRDTNINLPMVEIRRKQLMRKRLNLTFWSTVQERKIFRLVLDAHLALAMESDELERREPRRDRVKPH